MIRTGIGHGSLTAYAVIAMTLLHGGAVLAQSPAPTAKASPTATKPAATKTVPVGQVPAAANVPPPAAAPSATAAAKDILAGTTSDGEVVARAGDITLTAKDVRAFVAGLTVREQEALAKNPAVLSETVRSLLTSKLVLKEAIQERWEERPDVAARLARARELALIEAYLRDQSLPDSGFPTEAEIERVYQSNQAAFKVPRQYQLAQIFVALPKDAPKDVENKANAKLVAVQDKLKQPGANFAAIAKEQSDAPDVASNGGEIGWLNETLIRPEIRAQASGLKPGEIGDPIKLDDGYHVIKLLDTRADGTLALADVHDVLTTRLRDEQAATKRRAFLAKILTSNPPALNELSLAGVLAKQPDERAADKAGEKSAAR